MLGVVACLLNWGKRREDSVSLVNLAEGKRAGSSSKSRLRARYGSNLQQSVRKGQKHRPDYRQGALWPSYVVVAGVRRSWWDSDFIPKAVQGASSRWATVAW